MMDLVYFVCRLEHGKPQAVGIYAGGTSIFLDATQTSTHILEPNLKRLVVFAAIVCLLVLNLPRAFAQFETASVLGYVRDSSGAVVPNAVVSLINQETRAQVTVKTDAQGAYEFTDVKVGSYQVTSQAAGFDTTTTQAFLVQVN